MSAVREDLGYVQAVSRWSAPFDRWDVEANSHLLAHVMRRPKRYSPTGRPDDVTAARTMCLVRAKNRWAQCMREEATANDGRVDVETQKAVWQVEMQQAEREIDRLATEVA